MIMHDDDQHEELDLMTIMIIMVIQIHIHDSDMLNTSATRKNEAVRGKIGKNVHVNGYDII